MKNEGSKRSYLNPSAESQLLGSGYPKTAYDTGSIADDKNGRIANR